MKVVILAGGLGTRLSEETTTKPKPMVEIGGRPILWHIMKIYSSHGINDFVICCGYKGHMIKEYFTNYLNRHSDFTINLLNDSVEVHKRDVEPWKITLVDTGESSMTGGRLKRVSSFLDEDEPFCFTYGDGVADIDISSLINFHRSHGKEATITATYPPGRFGSIEIDHDKVTMFQEKPRGDGRLVNAGFFVLNKSVIDRIDNDLSVWEEGPLKSLSRDGELMAFKHDGFWQAMDKLSDKLTLEELWNNQRAPWKNW